MFSYTFSQWVLLTSSLFETGKVFNFSKKIKDVFRKVYNEPISVRFLRMSWISNLMKTNPTNKEMKKLAYEMAHSTDEQKRYNKILR